MDVKNFNDRVLVRVICDTRVGGHDWSDEENSEPVGPAYCYACGMQKKDYELMKDLLARLEAADRTARWLAAALSTYGPYTTKHPNDVLADFTAIAGIVKDSPDA